jgi:predicted N-acetyltransferase YhbS
MTFSATHRTSTKSKLMLTPKDLASLAVDPDFKGRGIASRLVKWGTDQADRDGLPTYVESTPAAVETYKRCGFREQKKLSVIKNNDGYFLTIMTRAPGASDT